MTRLSELVIARRRWIVLAWVLLTILGVYATGRLSDRWFESFSIPGYEAYEANQRALDTFGSGAQPPLVVVFQTDQGDVTKSEGWTALSSGRPRPCPARA
jgi:RND superfamily putative drug exporter